MKKICCLCLIFLLIAGCSKEITISLTTDTITVNVHDELPDSQVLQYVNCNNMVCSEDIELDIRRDELNLNKVGEYTIDVLHNGSGYPVKVKVIDVENPTIHVEPFTIEQFENIIWDREMYNRIQLIVGDNATDDNSLYNSVKVEGLDPAVAGEQEVTFTVKDASRNEASIKVMVTVNPKPVVVVKPTPPPVVVEPEVPEVTTPSDATGSDATPSDATPSDATGSDATPSDSTPSDATDTDATTPSDATGSDATPSDATASDATGSDATATDSTPSDATGSDGEKETPVINRVTMTVKEVMDLLDSSRRNEIIYVSQTWCSHCQAFVKTLDSYLAERDDLIVREVILDLEPQTEVITQNVNGEDVIHYVYADFETFKKEYKIDFVGTPSIFIIRNGRVRETLIGNQSIEILHDKLDSISNY